MGQGDEGFLQPVVDAPLADVIGIRQQVNTLIAKVAPVSENKTSEVSEDFRSLVARSPSARPVRTVAER